MPLVMRLMLCLVLLTGTSEAGWAQTQFQTRAEYVAILDYNTGEILFGKNADIAMPPASMSKLMTALMVFEALDDGILALDTQLVVSENAWRRGGAASGSSTMFLEVNSRARVDDLLRGIIIQSGNDACIVVAEALGGSEDNFAAMMTERAQELGFKSANFANSTGWPHPEHKISALDLARLAQHIISQHSDYYNLYAETEFTYNGIRQYNRNPLLGLFSGADGLKTGHTEDSGYGLVGTAIREGERRIIAFNGMESSQDRANEAERLMRAAFSEFEVIDIVSAGQLVGETEVYLGVPGSIAFKATQGLKVGVHKRDVDKIKAEVRYYGPISAPIASDAIIADLKVNLPDGRELSVPLTPSEEVKKQNLFARVGSLLVSWIRGS